VIDGFIEQMELEQRARAWLAWHSAALGRGKSMPSFEKFAAPQGGKSGKAPDVGRQTISEMAAAVRGWKAVLYPASVNAAEPPD
jgi:hypothetical protein